MPQQDALQYFYSTRRIKRIKITRSPEKQLSLQVQVGNIAKSNYRSRNINTVVGAVYTPFLCCMVGTRTAKKSHPTNRNHRAFHKGYKNMGTSLSTQGFPLPKSLFMSTVLCNPHSHSVTYFPLPHHMETAHRYEIPPNSYTVTSWRIYTII